MINIRARFRRRMLLVAVLPTLIFTALLSLVWVNWIQQELGTARQDRAEAVARQLAAAAEFHLFSGNLVALQALLDATSADERDIVGMAIFDRRGARLAGAGQPLRLADPAAGAVWIDGRGGGQHRLVLPIKPLSLTIDDLGGEAAAAGRGDNLLGYVVLAVSDAPLVQKRNRILLLAALLMLVAVVAGGLLSTLMAKGIVRSISGMITVVDAIGRGNFEARLKPNPGCVLYPLEDGLNRMAEHVSMNQDELHRRIEEATRELQAQKRTAEEEARIDPLTRLANRRAFVEQGEAEVQRALRYGAPLAMAMLDLDHFKQINDNHGHDVGDQVLVRLAETLGQHMREVDFVARMGGEEFAILMPDTRVEEATRVAERLRLAVADMVVEANGAALQCTASFGVSEFQAGDNRIQDLFVRADKALYQAKQGGRNRVEMV